MLVEIAYKALDICKNIIIIDSSKGSVRTPAKELPAMTHQELIASVNTAQIASLPPYQRLAWILGDLRYASIRQ